MKFVTLQTGDSIVAKLAGTVTTAQPTFITSWLDLPGQTIDGFTVSANNTTEITITVAPSSGARIVDSIRVTNNDSVAATVTVQMANGGTRYSIAKTTLAPGENRDILSSNTSALSTTIGGGRATLSYTTASIGSAAYETGSLVSPKGYEILRTITNYPARVRLYLSSAQRDADINRPYNANQVGNVGCILDVLTITGNLTFDMSPTPYFANPLSANTTYITINNADTVPRTIIATLNIFSMEA